MRNHESRHQLIEEMHLRRQPVLPVPGAMRQILRVVEPDEREAERAMLADALGRQPEEMAQSERHLAGILPDTQIQFVWERHTEGSSIIMIVGAGVPEDQISAARSWIEALPGRAVRATEIVLVKGDEEAEQSLPHIPIQSDEIVSGTLRAGIRFWSDFRLHDGDYGYVLIAANGADPTILSRSVQQLQELGNYRNLALLALPEVRKQWAELDAIENRLGAFAADVGKVDISDDALLERVSDLSADLANQAHTIGYRLNATKAYAELVNERLDDLNAIPVEGIQSLKEFSRRRFMPAVRTCAAHRDRLAELQQRAGDLTSLLRARINTRIENQNARLLKSMENRAETQLRLQQLVEGLSIFALTYYGVGLLGYVLHGLEEYLGPVSVDLVLAASVPIVMVLIWLAIHQLKRRIFRADF